MSGDSHQRDAGAVKRRVPVLGATMATVDVGAGPPVVFLHGNPTSSYLWRHVIPHVAPRARCVAPDLMGMGDSDKLAGGPDRYRLVAQRRHLDAFFEALALDEGVVLVGHEWGATLAFDRARRFPDQIRAIAYIEPILCPITWRDWRATGPQFLHVMRTSVGEEMAFEGNIFIESILPQGVLRQLDDAEMDAYRRPFAEPGEGRLPLLTWAREVPVQGRPEDVFEIVRAAGEHMESAPLPKLLLRAEAGELLSGLELDYCRTWPNQREVAVAGGHVAPEDAPEAIGRALAGWLAAL